MCAPLIRKFLSPIFVALPSGLPRWIVQYSRMTLSFPISTFVFRSGENETSCGGTPMIAPCPMKFPRPIATSPSITTCDCTIVCSPIVTCGPMIENGTDLYIGADFCIRIDDCCRMNLLLRHLSDFDIRTSGFLAYNTPASLKLK